MSTTTRGLGPSFRTAVLIAFTAGCLGFLGYLYAQAGGALPFVRADQYRVSFDVEQVGNVVQFADVFESGVRVGKVERLDRQADQTVRVTLTLDPIATPLHQGTTVEIIERSLLGQPAITLVDGTGAAYPDGTLLPRQAVHPPVTLRDVLASFDAPSRAALGGTLRELGAGTEDRQPEVAALARGLTGIGDKGDIVLAELAAQSNDLSQVSRQLARVFDALDVGQGQIADLVSGADRLSRATAGQRPALEATLRTLPGVMDSATAASGDISRLGNALGPVAADLRRSAPDLNDALRQMPDATADVRHLLPPLRDALDHAPDTLHRVPDFSDRAHELLPVGVDALREFNPIARYIKPYGHEIAAVFSNFGNALGRFGDDGASYLWVKLAPGVGSVRTVPLDAPQSLAPRNPYPAPGSLRDMRPFAGTYPRVHRDGP